MLIIGSEPGIDQLTGTGSGHPGCGEDDAVSESSEKWAREQLL